MISSGIYFRDAGMRRIRQTDTTSGGVSVLLVVLEWLQLLWIHQYIGKIKFKGRQWWERWKQEFNNLCTTGKGVSNYAQKRALLLHVASMDFQEIYFT